MMIFEVIDWYLRRRVEKFLKVSSKVSWSSFELMSMSFVKGPQSIMASGFSFSDIMLMLMITCSRKVIFCGSCMLKSEKIYTIPLAFSSNSNKPRYFFASNNFFGFAFGLNSF